MDSPYSIYTKLRKYPISDVLRSGPSYVRNQLLLRVQELWYRRQLHATSSQVAERRRAALDRLEGEGTVLFLCRGNICRSPFAERYTRQQLEARGIDEITVESSGFCEQPDRRSPPAARRTASRYGVRLDKNRSTQADSELLDRAALIWVMDYRNYHNFTRRFPDATDRMFLLGIFDGRAKIPISDPYQDTPETLKTSYDRIVSSVNGFLDAFESRSANRPQTISSDNE